MGDLLVLADPIYRGPSLPPHSASQPKLRREEVGKGIKFPLALVTPTSSFPRTLALLVVREKRRGKWLANPIFCDPMTSFLQPSF